MKNLAKAIEKAQKEEIKRKSQTEQAFKLLANYFSTTDSPIIPNYLAKKVCYLLK